MKKDNKKEDLLLGLNKKIDRRDFLNSSLLGAGSVLYSMSAPSTLFAQNDNISLPDQVGDNWYGYGGVGDSRYSHGNTPEILRGAHAVRDGLLSKSNLKNIPSSEEYDLVIVGGGLAGLGGAALGTMLGAVGGPFGAVAGGLGLGLISGFAGESIGMAIAQYLFDKKITAFGDGFLGKLINKAVGSPDAEAPLSIPTSSSGVDGGLAAAAAGGGMSTPPRTTGASVAQSVTAMSPGAMGGSAPSVVNAPTTMAIGSSQTTYAGGGVSTTDPRRPSLAGLPSSF